MSGTSITGSYAFNTAGVYSIMLTAHEAGGLVIANTVNAELLAEVVVYDPSAGFVTGGGWINSPAEEYIQNRDLSGKASFGFVSNYQKGANVPTGETEFNYQIAGFNFHSTSYQWLVVSGAMVRHYIGSS